MAVFVVCDNCLSSLVTGTHEVHTMWWVANEAHYTVHVLEIWSVVLEMMSKTEGVCRGPEELPGLLPLTDPYQEKQFQLLVCNKCHRKRKFSRTGCDKSNPQIQFPFFHSLMKQNKTFKCVNLHNFSVEITSFRSKVFRHHIKLTAVTVEEHLSA